MREIRRDGHGTWRFFASGLQPIRRTSLLRLRIAADAAITPACAAPPGERRLGSHEATTNPTKEKDMSVRNDPDDSEMATDFSGPGPVSPTLVAPSPPSKLISQTRPAAISEAMGVAAAAFCPAEDPDCLHRMRGWLRGLLNRPGGPYQPHFTVIELALNELAANAMQHTNSRDGGFAVCLLWDPMTLRAIVSDQGSSRSKPAAADRWDDSGESGRGLALVGALCDWGYTATPHGTDVWAVFHRDQTTSPAGHPAHQAQPDEP